MSHFQIIKLKDLPSQNCFGNGGETCVENVCKSNFPFNEKLFNDQ